MSKNIETFIGKKYEETKNFSLTKIKELIKKDLKYDIEQGNLPKGEYSISNFNSENYQEVIQIIVTNDEKLFMDEKRKYLDNIRNIMDKYNKITHDTIKDSYGARFANWTVFSTKQDWKLNSK